VEPSSQKNIHPIRLGQEALDRIAGTLSDLYRALYDERPVDPQASLTGNMLAFVFEGGLSVADESLLRNGRDDRLAEFRQQFFEVVDPELVAIVADLTTLPVTYSFYGFDPKTRTTHAIFVLDLSGLDRSEERQAVLNWSEQVRRNARRLREEHVATRETFRAMKAELKARRDQLLREAEASAEDRRSGD
jgi:hypothetical protein